MRWLVAGVERRAAHAHGLGRLEPPAATCLGEEASTPIIRSAGHARDFARRSAHQQDGRPVVGDSPGPGALNRLDVANGGVAPFLGRADGSQEQPELDLIIGSDLVYGNAIHDNLVTLLVSLLKRYPSATVLLAHERRPKCQHGKALHDHATTTTTTTYTYHTLLSPRQSIISCLLYPLFITVNIPTSTYYV